MPSFYPNNFLFEKIFFLRKILRGGAHLYGREFIFGAYPILVRWGKTTVGGRDRLTLILDSQCR